MIVAFGTSTPTSITVVATSTSSSPRVNAAIIGSALRRLQPAVDAADAVAAELVRPEALRLVLGRACERRLRALDERADDVRLTAVVEVPAQTVVRLGAPLLRHPGRDDRLPVRRRRGDLRDREVAVDRERERPRDRRRGHVEDVRAPPLRERGALLDAEAVLLVDDGDREVGELDLALDERVRADGDAARRPRRRAGAPRGARAP